MKTLLAGVVPFLLIMSSSSGALGIDPGTAKGTMRVGDDTITLTRAYAHVHDNA